MSEFSGLSGGGMVDIPCAHCQHKPVFQEAWGYVQASGSKFEYHCHACHRGFNVERPVSPATTREERIANAEELWVKYELRPADYDKAREFLKLHGYESKANLSVALLSAYLKSQSEKLVGIGQEAAEKINELHNLTDDYDADVAAIIDNLVAERLAK